MNIGLIVVGIYFIILSFALKTKNFGSSLIFKIIPFFAGLYCLFLYCVLSGWVNI